MVRWSEKPDIFIDCHPESVEGWPIHQNMLRQAQHDITTLWVADVHI